MIIGLIRRLGEIKLQESANVLLETYLKAQKPYKQQHIFALEVNLESGSFQLIIEEYDSNKETLYLRGIQGGMSENISPVLNLKPADLTEDPKKVLNLNKFPSEKTLFEKQGLGEEQFPLYSRLIRWYNEKKESILDLLLEKLENEYYDLNTKKVDKKAPTMIVFKVFREGEFRYPGEIPEIVDAYLQLATPPPPKEALKGICMACARDRALTPTDKLNTSLFEFFSLDLNNYVLGMEIKKSNQLTICTECQELLSLGLSVLENELRFRAYTRKINSKNTLFVEHSLIPTSYGKELVAEVIKSLTRIRRERAELKRNSLRKEIEQIQQKLSRIDKKGIRELKKKEKEIRETLEKVPDLEEVDERTILEEFVKKGVSYIDLYYVYESVGVGNFKKVFMDLTFINADFLKKLMNAVSNLERKFQNKDLLSYRGEPYRFEFANLYALFSIKIADLVRKSLLTGVPVSSAELSRDALRNLRDPFLKLNARIDKNIWINRWEYHRRLNTFIFIYQLMDDLNLLKE